MEDAELNKKWSQKSRKVVPGSLPHSTFGHSLTQQDRERLRDRVNSDWDGMRHILWGSLLPFVLLVTEPGPWGWEGRVSGWKQDGVETTR